MSRSYRQPICSNTCSGFRRGEKDDKQLSSRNIRRTNKSLIKESCCTEDLEPIHPLKVKRSIEVYKFRKDGKSRIDPEICGDRFHFKKLPNGKVKMTK